MTFIESMTAASQAYTAALAALAVQTGVSLAVISLIISAISLWALVWKGLALWKSAKKNSPIWFIVLLAVNTMGILEILYIFVFSKMDKKKSAKRKARKK